MKCEFKLTDNPDIKKCCICGFEWKTKAIPEKLNRICPRKQPEGLGDTTAKIIDKITFGYGLKTAEAIAHAAGLEDCGCGDRQEWLNKRFPHKE